MADNFEAAIEVSPEDIESKELSVQCSSVVLLDCSCGLPMYRAAMVIEPSVYAFAIRTTIQRRRVYYPSSSYQQGSGDQTAEAGTQSPTRHSEGQAPGRPASSGKSSLKPPKVGFDRASTQLAVLFEQQWQQIECKILALATMKLACKPARRA